MLSKKSRKARWSAICPIITNSSSQIRQDRICPQITGHLSHRIMSPAASDKARLQIQKRQEKVRRQKHAAAQRKYRQK